MSKQRKPTGLGTDAFFRTPNVPEVKPTIPKHPGQTQEGEAPQSRKVRTTVTLYPDTLAALEMLKVYARKQGERMTYSDILDEAISNLIEKKGIKV